MLPSLNGSEGFVVSRRFPIEDPSHIGDVRRHLTRLAQDLQFSAERVAEVAIVVNELANNLLQHAGRGEIIAREICNDPENDRYGIEILSIDRGPGMRDPEACLQDGYTTASTPGQGLGAIHRLSDFFDLYSRLGQGTVVAVELTAHPFEARARVQWSVVCVPIAGETACGDAWAVVHPVTGDAVIVVDGLGHGALASAASHEAIRLFREQGWGGLEDYIRSAHEALRATRGAAISALVFDTISEELRYVGVGNVRAARWSSGKLKTLISYPGTVGLKLNAFREIKEAWAPGDLLIIHSDGVSAKWDLTKYPALTNRSPGVIAGVLYRDFSRGNDDACIWVGKAKRDE